MSYCKILKAYFPITEMELAFIDKNTQALVHKSLTVECLDCHEIVWVGFAEEDSYKNYLCKHCEERYNYIKCDDCGSWTDRHISVDDGEKRVCEDCLEYYHQCINCCQWYSDDCGTQDNDGDFACQGCIDSGDIEICEHCGVLIHYGDAYHTADDVTLCEWCCDNHTENCDVCSMTYYHGNNIEYDEDEDMYICEECRQRHIIEESQTEPRRAPNIINGYTYKPKPFFLKCENEDTNEFFGFEIEVEGARTFAEDFQEIVGNDIYIKQDGSVMGFEIVTHPMTRMYFYQVFVPKLQMGMQLLRTNGFRAHNRAGIHIHVSNKAITNDMLARMVDVVYQRPLQNQKIWQKITQRKAGELNRWASMKTNSLLFKNKKATIQNVKSQAETEKKPTIGSCRYTAINTNNQHTTEFRIFNSNLRIERIIKNAQVIFSLMDFSKTKTKASLQNYLSFIFKHENEYNMLCDFLIEKHIYNPHSVYDQLVLELEPIDDDDNERITA